MTNRFIGVGLPLVFLTFIVLIVGIGTVGTRAMKELHAQGQSIAHQQWVDVQLANQALSYSNQNSQINIEIFLTDDPSVRDSLLGRRAYNSASISVLLGQLQSRVGSNQEQDRLNDLFAARMLFLASDERAVRLLLEGQHAEARKALIQDSLPRLIEYQAAFRNFAQFQADEMNGELNKSSVRYARSLRMMQYLLTVAVLLAVGIASFVISKMLAEIRRRLRAEVELRQLNQELEAKVLQRTAALEKSNQVLLSETTERRRNEELVRRLYTAVEQCPVSVVITDLSGNITYVNRKFVDCTGYSFEEAIGQNPRILKSGHTPAEEYHRLWQTITAGNEWRGEFCNRKKNGESYWEYAAIRPIRNEKGEIAHFLAIKEDITERRRLQAQLQQVQKLESVGQLAAGIAHEINTPMQFVGDNTRFLQQAWSSVEEVMKLCCSMPSSSVDESIVRQVVQKLEAADFKYLQKEVPAAIENSLDGIQRVSKIVRAMKDFSHPGSDEKQLVDLNHAIETTVTVARNEWKYVAEVETAFAEDVGLVPCYIGEFNQVILNLLVNATHAISEVMGEGSKSKGKITIRTRRDADWVEISVQDSGCGIPPAIQPHVFDLFFTTKPVGKGTGQGLALAYAVIVKKHEGKIWFETKEDEGTTFFVRLPAPVPTDDLACQPAGVPANSSE